jgi:hypothetical protein
MRHVRELAQEIAEDHRQYSVDYPRCRIEGEDFPCKSAVLAEATLGLLDLIESTDSEKSGGFSGHNPGTATRTHTKRT